MNPKRVVIVGGSGFIGSAIANRLCEAGAKVLIPTRRRSRAGHVLLLPNAEVVEAAARLFDTLRQADRLAGPGGRIAFAPVPETGLGLAINDRLRRAAAPR